MLQYYYELKDQFLYWLSYKLITSGIQVVPDEHVKAWLKYGVIVAMEGVESESQ